MHFRRLTAKASKKLKSNNHFLEPSFKNVCRDSPHGSYTLKAHEMD